MRKKSHISLAKYMVNDLKDEDLNKHRMSFYIGSILPDIKPSFFYKKHQMPGTFPEVKHMIKNLSEKAPSPNKNRKYYRDLGQVSHYLADYFTYPHTEIYKGGDIAHNRYEYKLKNDFKKFLENGEAKKIKHKDVSFPNPDSLCRYIQKAHDEYVSSRKSMQDDMRSIIMVNHNALHGILNAAPHK